MTVVGGWAILKAIRSVLPVPRTQLSAVEGRLARAASVEDLRRLARRRLPRNVFDSIDGGAEGEVSLRRNVEAFQRAEFRPRVLRDVGLVDPSTTLLGRPLPLPLALAPTGFSRIVSAGGELDVAKAAARVRLPYTLSTLATCSIEEVAAVSDGPRWLQVYAWRDRGLVKDMLVRAAAAGYEAIVITVDTPVLGRRERDVRTGFTLPPKADLRTLATGVLHPSWTWNFLRAGQLTFSNVTGGRGPDAKMAVNLAEYVSRQFDPSLSWRDIDWFRTSWGGPIVVKGIQTVEDAKIAVEAGVEAIALSNHGGRQLDGAPPPLELVAPVADAVGGLAEIICDGGIRRGSDLVKAVALGARACMIGRAYLYGLAAAGERGVEHVLALLDADVRRTMTLCGCRSIPEIRPELIRWRDTSV
jgi:L-lactate dehydrogenase (cytochrome)